MVNYSTSCQYSRADLRHLKALAWMVSALICSGQRAPTRLGTVCAKGERPNKVWSGDGDGFGQSAGAGQSDVSATRDDRVKRMEPSSSVSCPGHHRLVEPVRETQVSRLLWSCGAIAVASLSTWQCDRCKEYQPLLRKLGGCCASILSCF